jgi:hypothetical protein
MKKYTFSFDGRIIGAKGNRYRTRTEYMAPNLSDAKKQLYDEYEHIIFVSGIVGNQPISKDEFLKA